MPKTDINQIHFKEPEFQNVLSFFEEISKIPRCSKHEEKIASYLENFGKEHGFETKRDSSNNVLIKVPASSNCENRPTVILQAHMDMVCEKEADSNHDFSKDGLKLSYILENEILYLAADKTTLGADDGIGIAYALAVAASKEIIHPPLELLFTTDEEQGLTGAQEMSDDFISGDYLINLDSEEEGTIIIGCAGGAQVEFRKQFETAELLSSDSAFYAVSVSGLLGGHSGTEIHIGRRNANKILAQFMTVVCEKPDSNLKIIDVSGGSAHNAIPRDAKCLFSADASAEELKTAAEICAAQIKSELGFNDADFQISVSAIDISNFKSSAVGFSAAASVQILQFLTAIPTGVFDISQESLNFVSSSGNLATVKTDFKKPGQNEIEIICSLRSDNESKLNENIKDSELLAETHSFDFELSNIYTPWEPDFKSPLVLKCKKIYSDMFQKNVQILSIHAGLECSVFRKKYPSLPMISIGPDIVGAHTPSEKLNLEAAEKVWIYLKEILKSF
jgi:aminoacyl-histidine dipeptidase